MSTNCRTSASRSQTVPNGPDGTFLPYLRDPTTLARPWAIPGTPGLEHRFGGLEKADLTGNVSYDADNHERMTILREDKIAGIANDIPPVEVVGADDAELLVLGWGSTFGAIRAGVNNAVAEGWPVAHVHLRYINPLPANLGDVLAAHRLVLVPELNRGQLSRVVRAEYLVDAISYSKVQGQPFMASELIDEDPRTAGREGRGMTDTARYERADFQTDQEVRWCPGCGDYTILASVQNYLATLDIDREKHVFISGIGCSSRFPYYMNTYGMHSIHGRAPAVASGVATANPDLTVWVITGDGDGLSIGGNHLIHALRRNVNLKILLFNNQIYGLTKGQYSPTSEIGKRTKTSPMGSIDRPFNPVSLALGAEATFVARTIDMDRKHTHGDARRRLRAPRHVAASRSTRTATSSTTRPSSSSPGRDSGTRTGSTSSTASRSCSVRTSSEAS